jgi:hypothetical protein
MAVAGIIYICTTSEHVSGTRTEVAGHVDAVRPPNGHAGFGTEEG